MTELKYPEWAREHLTPHLEVQTVSDPGTVELWVHPRQRIPFKPYLHGFELYGFLKEEGLLERSLSFGELKFLEANPHRIPVDWRTQGLNVYAWASVVRGDWGDQVPYLSCGIDPRCQTPQVFWVGIAFGGWGSSARAGLRAA